MVNLPRCVSFRLQHSDSVIHICTWAPPGVSVGKESVYHAGDTGARVRSLGQEGLPEEGMATHSSILAGGIPRRGLVGYSPWGDRESDMADGTDHTRACVPIYSFKSQAVITCLIIGKILNMAPCVYSRSLLSICSMYSSVCLFTPNSQFIPPSLPPFPFGKDMFVFCVWESVSILYISSFISLFQIPHIRGITVYLSSSVWLKLKNREGFKQNTHIP